MIIQGSHRTLRNVCAILVLLDLILAPMLFAQDAGATRPDRLRQPEHHHHTILVTGSAEISVVPDQAVVRFGMTAQNSRASVAQSKVNEVMQKAIDAIVKAGVNRQSIHTTGISLSPVYTDKILSSGGSKISAFRADNDIEVAVDDIKLVGDIIDAAVSAGANEVQGVYFRLKDDRAQRYNALTQASQEAKTKAETIAKALGVPLGNAIEASETTAHSPRPMGNASPAFLGLLHKEMAPTPVQPGQIRIETTVTVRYEIGGGPGK